MKVLFATLNAQYIHSSLALAYLKSYCQGDFADLHLMEYTINDNPGDILYSVYRIRPDVLCFSCYIWNIEDILNLCRDFKAIVPQCTIVLGGPEASYAADELLRRYPQINIVVRGEGEQTTKELLQALSEGQALRGIAGISYREDQMVCHNEDRAPLTNLDIIPFPYEDLSAYQNRVVYYETSRGCPFGCSYCLSAAEKGLRYFSLERVKHDLEILMHSDVREIKLVDRTFNSDEKRSRAIMSFIAENQPSCRFHFEICGDRLSDDMVDYLTTIPPGLFEFEIGVQSTHEPALQAIHRRQDWKRLQSNMERLKTAANIHLHLDLIAGLPQEGYREFSNSFNQVYNLKPHMLQLGFLKLLKGSPLWKEADRHGYVWQARAPYQVLANRYISYAELAHLQLVENLLNRYYNRGRFVTTLDYMAGEVYAGKAFDFYSDLADFWEERDLFSRGHRDREEYTILKDFVLNRHPDHGATVNEYLKYDYLKNFTNHDLPPGLDCHNPPNRNEIQRRLLGDPAVAALLSTGDNGEEIPLKVGRKGLHLEYFLINPLNGSVAAKPLPLLFYYPDNRPPARVMVANDIMY